MRLPRVRITLRRMMVLVGVAAFMMATGGAGVAPIVSRRWNACEAASNRHAQLVQWYSVNAVQSAVSREKAKVHRQASRMNWWAFFDPFHECILDKDIY